MPICLITPLLEGTNSLQQSTEVIKLIQFFYPKWIRVLEKVSLPWGSSIIWLHTSLQGTLDHDMVHGCCCAIHGTILAWSVNQSIYLQCILCHMTSKGNNLTSIKMWFLRRCQWIGSCLSKQLHRRFNNYGPCSTNQWILLLVSCIVCRTEWVFFRCWWIFCGSGNEQCVWKWILIWVQ